jgi:hypothetical protein
MRVQMRRNNHFREVMRGPNHADNCLFRSDTEHWRDHASSAEQDGR